MASRVTKWLRPDGSWKECLTWNGCVYSSLHCLGITRVFRPFMDSGSRPPEIILVHDDFGFLVSTDLNQVRVALTGDAR